MPSTKNKQNKSLCYWQHWQQRSGQTSKVTWTSRRKLQGSATKCKSSVGTFQGVVRCILSKNAGVNIKLLNCWSFQWGYSTGEAFICKTLPIWERVAYFSVPRTGEESVGFEAILAVTEGLPLRCCFLFCLEVKRFAYQISQGQVGGWADRRIH